MITTQHARREDPVEFGAMGFEMGPGTDDTRRSANLRRPDRGRNPMPTGSGSRAEIDAFPSPSSSPRSDAKKA